MALTSSEEAVTEWGQVVGLPAAQLVGLTQEFGVLRCSSQAEFDELKIGSTVQVIPNHSCLTAACFPQVHCYDAQGVVTDTWITAPRRWI